MLRIFSLALFVILFSLISFAQSGEIQKPEGMNIEMSHGNECIKQVDGLMKKIKCYKCCVKELLEKDCSANDNYGYAFKNKNCNCK